VVGVGAHWAGFLARCVPISDGLVRVLVEHNMKCQTVQNYANRAAIDIVVLWMVGCARPWGAPPPVHNDALLLGQYVQSLKNGITQPHTRPSIVVPLIWT
jgi:hypothetical protein